jgi:hypothetical protein
MAEGLNDVGVAFSRPFNAPSASDPKNYTFEPDGKAIAVSFATGSPDELRLVVDGLRLNAEYTVTVKNVFSRDGKPLNHDHNRATFITPGA